MQKYSGRQENLNWLVEQSVFPENANKIKEVIENIGGICKLVDTVDLISHDFSQYFPNESNTIFYGSLSNCRDVIKKTRWSPGSYYNITDFYCSNYYPQISSYLLNKNYIMLPIGDHSRIEEITEDRPFFARPNTGFKLFTGQVFSNISDLIEKTKECTSPNDIIVIAKPQNIEKEWRIVIADGKCVTGSQYMEASEIVSIPNIGAEIQEYAEVVSKNLKIEDPIYVMDICLCMGEYRVLELNAFSCSGLYSCDIEKVVNTVELIARSNRNESD